MTTNNQRAKYVLPDEAIAAWLSSVSSSELAIASLINSVADKIDQVDVANADTLKVCDELRQMITQVLNLITERHKWVYQTILILEK